MDYHGIRRFVCIKRCTCTNNNDGKQGPITHFIVRDWDHPPLFELIMQRLRSVDSQYGQAGDQANSNKRLFFLQEDDNSAPSPSSSTDTREDDGLSTRSPSPFDFLASDEEVDAELLPEPSATFGSRSLTMREDEQSHRWGACLDCLVEKTGDGVLNTYISSQSGSTQVNMNIKRVVEAFHNIDGGSSVEERAIFEKAIVAEMVDLEIKFVYNSQNYRGSIKAPSTHLQDFLAAVIFETIEFDEAPFSTALPPLCSSRWDYPVTPVYRAQFVKLQELAREHCCEGEIPVAACINIFQDSTALGGIGGQSVNPIIAISLLTDTFARRKVELNEILAMIIPDIDKANFSRNDITVPWDILSREVREVFNREFVIEAMRQVATKIERCVSHVALSNGQRICFASSILLGILDSPAKAAMSATMLGSCPVCEDGRYLPKFTTGRQQEQLMEVRELASGKQKLISELNQLMGIHASTDPFHYVDGDGLRRIEANETMHVDINCWQHYMERVAYAMSGVKVRQTVDGRPVKVDIDFLRGGAFFVKEDGSTMLPSKSRSKAEDDKKSERLKQAQKSARFSNFTKRAQEIGGEYTTLLLTTKGKMLPRLMGVDGLLLAMLTRNSETGDFVFFEDQDLALVCIQAGVLLRCVSKSASDVAAGFLLPRLRKITELLRFKWLQLSGLVGIAHESIAIHYRISHTVSSVEKYGNTGLYDSPTKESGHKVTKSTARTKQNHQNRDRKSNKNEKGQHANLQVVKSRVRNYVSERWFKRRFSSTVPRLPPVLLQGQRFGKPRRYEGLFKLLGNWTLSHSLEIAQTLFPQVVFNSCALDDFSPSRIYSKMDGQLVDNARTTIAYKQGTNGTVREEVSRDLLLPKESICAIGSREDRSRILVWDENENIPGEGACRDAHCFGCWKGWLSSCANAVEEEYGLPLGFVQDEDNQMFAVVIKLYLDRSIEPALFRFSNMESVVEDFECGYGAFVFTAEPVIRLINVCALKGTALFFDRVACGMGHFVVYRKTENLFY